MKQLIFPLLALTFAATIPAVAQGNAPTIEVRINGRPAPLHEFHQGTFALIPFEGPMDVEIRTHFNTRWVDVRPLAASIQPVIGADHETVRFHLDKPANLTVEFNRDLGKVLHLFAYAPETDAPAPGTKGVRYFGPGLHEAGVIDLTTGEVLYLAPGAWVRGCVRAVNVHDIAILGRGVLDGSGLDAARAAVPEPSATDNPAYADWNHNMIFLKNVARARLGGITLFDSRAWTVYLRECRDVTVDGMRILNPSVHYGNDGFDVVSSSRVLIQNVFVRTNDDCVVVKNLADVPMQNVVVRDSVMWNMPTGGNALEVGFEMRGATTSQLRFANIDIIHVERGAAISIHQGDHGLIENVLFENIRVEDVRRKVIDFCVLYAQYGLDRAPTAEERRRNLDVGGVWDGEQRFPEAERAARAQARGHVRNVRVKNLQVVDGALPYSIVAGFDEEHRVDDVVIEGFSYLGRLLRSAADARLVVAHAHGLELR